MLFLQSTYIFPGTITNDSINGMSIDETISPGQYSFPFSSQKKDESILSVYTEYSSLQEKDLTITQDVKGKNGELRPYSLKMSDSLTLLMLVSFFLFAYVYTKGIGYITQMFQNLLGNTERESIFVNNTTTSEYQIKFSLLLQTAISLSVFFFIIIATPFGKSDILLTDKDIIIYSSLFLLIIFLFWGIKWLINEFLGFIFFDKQKVSLWQNNYFSSISLFGTILFPTLLFLVHTQSHILIGISKYLFFFLMVLGFILIVYKGIRFFLVKPYGIFYFILYFCALEIIPYVGLYKGLVYIYNFV